MSIARATLVPPSPIVSACLIHLFCLSLSLSLEESRVATVFDLDLACPNTAKLMVTDRVYTHTSRADARTRTRLGINVLVQLATFT